MLSDRPLIIAYDGNGNTHLFADGKVHGNGIMGILFEAKVGKRHINPTVDVRITADDVNIVGSKEMDDILSFRMMIDRIMKQASTNE